MGALFDLHFMDYFDGRHPAVFKPFHHPFLIRLGPGSKGRFLRKIHSQEKRGGKVPNHIINSGMQRGAV